MSSLLQYKCPCCGGVIEFDSDLQKLICPYCDTEFAAETLAAYDEELKGEQADETHWQTPNETWAEGEFTESGMKLYVCESCGGEVVTEETTAAMRCPWCDNPIVMKGNLAGSLMPNYVLPFKLDREEAKAGFASHLNNKKFLPAVFKEEAHIDEIKGIYVPFWLYDATTDATATFRGTQTSSWRQGDYLYTRTSFYLLSRRGVMDFENVPVDGSRKMPDDLMESLEPFDASQLVDFQTAYLSGFLADKYDVPADESVSRANARIKTSCENTLRSTTAGYSAVTRQNGNVQIDNGKAKYALLPVWILNTTWEGQQYTFAMNGQTGKFVGNLPLDKKAKNRYFWKHFLLASGIVFAAVFLIWLLLG